MFAFSPQELDELSAKCGGLPIRVGNCYLWPNGQKCNAGFLSMADTEEGQHAAQLYYHKELCRVLQSALSRLKFALEPVSDPRQWRSPFRWPEQHTWLGKIVGDPPGKWVDRWTFVSDPIAALSRLEQLVHEQEQAIFALGGAPSAPTPEDNDEEDESLAEAIKAGQVNVIGPASK